MSSYMPSKENLKKLANLKEMSRQDCKIKSMSSLSMSSKGNLEKLANLKDMCRQNSTIKPMATMALSTASEEISKNITNRHEMSWQESKMNPTATKSSSMPSEEIPENLAHLKEMSRQESMKNPMRGACQKMCPNKEMHWRREHKLIHILEAEDGTENLDQKEPDPGRTIKQYLTPSYRPVAASRDEIRTPEALLETTRYLLEEVSSRTDQPWNIIYDFIVDRLRAVRQDMVVQDIQGVKKVKILEYCCLFHLYAGYRMIGAPIRIYADHLNSKFLKECIGPLMALYDEIDRHATRRILFECIYMLMDFGSPQVLMRLGSLPESVKSHEIFALCHSLSWYMYEGNYHKVIQNLQRLPIILKIAINSRLPTVYQRYITTLCHGFSSNNCRFPLNYLARCLIPYEEDSESIDWIREALDNHLIEVNEDDMVIFDKTKFLPDHQIPVKKWEGIDKALETRSLMLLMQEFI